MQIYLACSKTMTDCYNGTGLPVTQPHFLKQAEAIADDLNKYSASELQNILHVNASLATLNKARLMDFGNPQNSLPAIMAYTGTAFKAFRASEMSLDNLQYADSHILIGSFLYGMNRPFDIISPYRLEGDVTLSVNGHDSLFDYWRPILTSWFIGEVRNDDGILLNLASNEYMKLLDWKRVCRELTVVTPQFKVDFGNKLKTVALYAKMCRGAMARWVIDNRITNPDDIVAFTYNGFESHGKGLFVMTP